MEYIYRFNLSTLFYYQLAEDIQEDEIVSFMKKSRFSNKSEEIRYYKLKELKVYREREKRSKRFFQVRSINENFFQTYGKRFQSGLAHFLKRKFFLSEKYINTTITAPRNFTFHKNHDVSILFLKRVISSITLSPKSITIDFTNCSVTELATILILQIFLFEQEEFKLKYNRNSFSQLSRAINVKPSKSIAVNKILLALEIIDSLDNEEISKEEMYLPLKLNIGAKARKSLFENNKGAICMRIIKFIDTSLMGVNYKLNTRGRLYMDSLIAEILGNAEDHSDINRWYVNGVSFKTYEDHMTIVELNLSIVNFGYSIFEGFVDTKSDNILIYKKLEDAYEVYRNNISKSGFFGSALQKECLFTLFALQEGISRIKYEYPSRGNGTMNFIRAFFDLGGLGDEIPKYKPILNFFSGKTSLNCDYKYKPFQKGNFWILALNEEKDLSLQPDRKCLNLKNEYLPGTILQVKVFLNEEYFTKLTHSDE